MSQTASGRRRQGPGRLDPTVRGLLRAFLSPAVADRYASALQPIAVADRDAAIAGAVSTLRARFYVPSDEIAVALVEDAGWSVADVATMLTMSVPAVRAALRLTVDEEPRIGAAPPSDLDEVDDEAAAVEAMLGGLPRHRRDAAEAAAEEVDVEEVDVELATTLPAFVGLPDLEAQFARADRIQRLVVNLTAVGVLGLAAIAIGATRSDDAVTVPREPVASPSTDGDVAQPTPGPAPTPSVAGPPVGPPVLDAARFVADVDPATGEPGTTLDTATTDDDPRIWLRFSQLPSNEPIVTLTFTAPSGRQTVRPVLLLDRTPLVSVRLPDELGRAPGRYAVRIEADDLAAEVVELELREPDDAGTGEAAADE